MTPQEMQKIIEDGLGPVVARLDAVETAQRVPVTTHAVGIGDTPTPVPARVRVRTHHQKVMAARESVIAMDKFKGVGIDFGCWLKIKAVASYKGITLEHAADELGREDLAQLVLEQRALASGTLADGGALVPDEFVPQVIELLATRSVIRSLNPMMLPMATDSMTLPKLTGGATAYYHSENSVVTASQQTFGQVKLSAHKLGVLVPISNDLLRTSSPQVDIIVRNDAVRAAALREDLAFIRGDGTEDTPRGIGSLIASASDTTDTDGASPTLSQVETHLEDNLIGKLEDADVPTDSDCAFVMNPRSKRYIAKLRDSGIYPYKEEIRRDELAGYRLRHTTQIPINLNVSSSNDDTEIYFGNFADAVIGDALAMELLVVPNGTYETGGVVYSGLSRDQTVIKLLMKHDFALRHDLSFARLKGVRW